MTAALNILICRWIIATDGVVYMKPSASSNEYALLPLTYNRFKHTNRPRSKREFFAFYSISFTWDQRDFQDTRRWSVTNVEAASLITTLFLNA